MPVVYYRLHRGGTVTPTELDPKDPRPLRDQGILTAQIPAGHQVIAASYQIEGDRLILQTEKPARAKAKKDPEGE